MCAVSRVPENVSRTSVAFGVASLAILLTGFVTGSWVTTREPYRVPGTEAHMAAAFRIGLWKICPTLKTVNSTFNFRSLSCKYIRYTGDWDSDLAKEDVGIDSDVYFTQMFVAKMRWCTPLVGISVCLMLAGCIFSFSGHLYKDQKTLIASSLHTLAGLILAAGLFVFASVLNDSFSPVVHQSVDGGDDDDGNGGDDGFGGVLRSEYDYRYGWSFVACSLAFLTSEASAVFTITAYFRRLEDRVQYTAVDRKPSPDTPPSTAGDRSSACSMDARTDSPDTSPGSAAVDMMTGRPSDHLQSAAGRHQTLYANGGVGTGVGDGNPTGGMMPSSGAPSAAEVCTSAASKTPPDICPPKIGCDDVVAATISVAVPAQSAAARLQSAGSYSSATLNHHPSSAHGRHHQHYRQTLAVAGTGSCYEVDTSKPCTCGSAATTTTKRYATIAGVARHNSGKLQYTTTTTALTTAAAANSVCTNNSSGSKRLQVTGRSSGGGLSAIKETVGGPADHHHLQHHVQHQHQHQHHRKPDPPTRRLKASVGGYVVPQTPIAALEALDCPPAADPRLVLPSSV